MNKAEVLRELAEGRAAFMEALNGLSDEDLLQDGVIGEWSIKDVLFHLTMWEAELVKLLWQVSQNQVPSTIHFSEASDEEINRDWVNLGQERPLDQVWQDFHAVRKQTVRRVEALSPGDFDDPQRFPWLKGQPLSTWIAGSSFQHEAEHAEQIRLWRENLP